MVLECVGLKRIFQQPTSFEPIIASDREALSAEQLLI
jgi:hypothetical protein